MTISVSNPFTTGVTESITDDKLFLALFEPAVLESIPWGTALQKPLIFWLSAEGGGKTTILRTFTPNILKIVARGDETDPTYQTLLKIGALDRAGPRYLGVHCKGSLSYSYLNDIAPDETSRKRMFFALLNARAILRGLKSLTEALELRYPDDLGLLHYDIREDAEGLPPDFDMRGSGETLRHWARNIEKACLEAIDAGGATPNTKLPQHDFIAAQLILDPGYWRNDTDIALPKKTLIMLDDAQELTKEQRSWLANSVTREREGAHVWVASRHSALDVTEQFVGAQAGRELERIRLEDRWSTQTGTSTKPKLLREYLIKVGNRRIKTAPGTAFNEYVDMLELRPDGTTVEGRKVRETCEKLLERLQAQVAAKVKGTRKFDKWIKAAVESSLSPYDRLLELRHTLIIIERVMTGSQQQISDTPLPMDDFEGRSNASTRHAAQAFLSREHGLPLYYGAETMAYLATNNVQQFIRISERLYEEALSRSVKQAKDAPVPCEVQDRVIRQLAEERWNDLRSRFQDGREMQRLLETVVLRLHDDYARLTAPYAPAPVGISIPTEEYDRLRQADDLTVGERELRHVLSRCLAENLLYVERRHDKSEPHHVFYLNGMVLAKHGFPVNSRQFQPTSLEDLASWYKEGYTPQKKDRTSMGGKKRKQRTPSARERSTLRGFLEQNEGDASDE